MQNILPYIKSTGVFFCPDDTAAGQPVTTSGFGGVQVSYALNDMYTYSGDTLTVVNGYSTLRGLGGIDVPGNTIFGGTLFANTLARVQRPAESIMIAEKYSADANTSKITFGGDPGVPSGFGPNCVIAGPWVDSYNWGAQNEPNGTRTVTTSPAYDKDWNGAVSVHHTGFSNFLFCDGHVKAMRPVATNPDGTNQPQNNMWDVTRS